MMEPKYRRGGRDVDFDGLCKEWNELIVTGMLAGGSDGPNDTISYKDGTFNLLKLHTKAPSDLSRAAAEQYGRVERALARGQSVEQRREHFKDKEGARLPAKEGPAAKVANRTARATDRAPAGSAS